MVQDGLVQCIAFAPNAKYLAVGGEEMSVVVWNVDANCDQFVESTPALILPRQSSVHSVGFSDVSLVFASGSLATVYGMGHNESQASTRARCHPIPTPSHGT